MARARPRTVEERRRDIIAATVPLLEEEGFSVSTRRIADAAGVAEGTVFRVFATKDELLRSALAAHIDPTDLIARINAMDRDRPLEDQVREILVIVREAASRMRVVMQARRSWRLEAIRAGRGENREAGWPGPVGPQVFRAHSHAFRDAIVAVLEPHRDDVTVDLGLAATYIVTTGVASVVMAVVFPAQDADEVVSLTLRALKKQGKET